MRYINTLLLLLLLLLLSVNKWRDLETGDRGGSRLLKMAPFNRSHTTFYWSAIVNIAQSCTVFELFDVE